MNLRRRDPAYCFGVSGIAKAPWRPTQRQAMADAVDVGFGWLDEHPVPPNAQGMAAERTIYLHALAEIWTTHELVPVLPRNCPATMPPAPRSAPAAPVENLSRIDRIIARREGRG